MELNTKDIFIYRIGNIIWDKVKIEVRMDVPDMIMNAISDSTTSH